MGETQNQPFHFSFNPSLKVDFQGSRVTSDGGLILVRELDERLGFSELTAYHYQNGLVVAALMILIAAICFSRLHQLPVIRATVYNESDPRVFEAAVLPGFIQQSPKAPKLVAFRQHTASLVTDTDDELSRIVAVQHWVRGQESDKQFYRQAGQEPGPEVDNTEEPEQYLEQQHRGIPSACRRFSYILTGALLSVGINARVVSVAESLNQSAGLAAHNLVEVWVQKFHKWIETLSAAGDPKPLSVAAV